MQVQGKSAAENISINKIRVKEFATMLNFTESKVTAKNVDMVKSITQQVHFLQK